MDWWRSKRPDRASLDVEQQIALRKIYKETFNQLTSHE
jgi:hypothetical protein